MRRDWLLKSFVLASVIMAACGGGGGGSAGASSEKTMTSFGFASLAEAGAISGDAVAVTVPFRTDVTALVATFAVSDGASVEVNGKHQVSAETPNDFTSPVTYTVKAADGTSREYVVTASAPRLLFSFGLQRKADISQTVPALLQDGAFYVLPDNATGFGTARQIVVAGTDVEVAGSVGSPRGPAYWKNRTLKTLPLPGTGGTGEAKALWFTGSHLYASGSVYDGDYGDSNAIPGYWLDDAWQPLSGEVGTETALQADAGAGLRIDGSDVYLCGWAELPSHGGKHAPVYWKNGVAYPLPLDWTAYDGGEVTNVQPADSSVYATGYLFASGGTDPIPVYWKDGGPATPLPIGAASHGAAWGYKAFGGDRYTFGMVGDWSTTAQPVYWKNWELNVLPLPAGTTHGYANWITSAAAMGLAGNDVYIDGKVYDSGGRGVLSYWLNGAPHTIPLPADLAADYAGVVDQNMFAP